MPTCPSCGAGNEEAAVLCRSCGVSISPPIAGATDQGDWVEVFSGRGPALRGLEEELERRGITTIRMPAQVGAAFEVGIFGTDEGSIYLLQVPRDQFEARSAEIEAAVEEFAGTDAGDPAAQAEAEQDYDVRGCPDCGLFFHDNYAECPNTATPLVPAVEVFGAGQLEPEWVVVRDGSETEMRDVAAQFETSLFKARLRTPPGWTRSVVEISWAGLMDRTAEAETIIRG